MGAEPETLLDASGRETAAWTMMMSRSPIAAPPQLALANWAATSNPISPGFIGRITTVRRRPDKAGSSITITRERAIVSS